MDITQRFNLFQQATVAGTRLLHLLEEKPALSGEDDRPIATAHFHLDAVRFRHAGAGHDTLHGIDLDIPPGTFLGIVGPTGSGKSTLLDLLAGLQPVTGGSLCLDGRELGSLTPEVLGAALASVPQEPFIRSSSLRDNLLLGSQVPDARLREAAARHGIAPERLVFMPPVDMAAHWNRLAAADLALDTWPYNGHTTTSDALAAGVPVVTLRGDGFASRVEESLLAEAGLPELVCETLDDYVERACALATGPRPPIRPWIDSRAFARDLEALYRRMWARAVAGLPPDALPAASVPVAPAGDAADARRP